MSTITQDLHPIVVHFPIALLVVSVLLSFWGLRKTGYQETTWVLLVIGALATIPATITGLIAHFPYEETVLHEVIETHQLTGFFATFYFLGLLAWRRRARNHNQDIDGKPAYLVAGAIGVVILVFLGMTGGDLVYEYGINVRGINPLLQ